MKTLWRNILVIGKCTSFDSVAFLWRGRGIVYTANNSIGFLPDAYTLFATEPVCPWVRLISVCFCFPLYKKRVSKKRFSIWRRKQRGGGGMGDEDFIRSSWKSWEWCPLAATSCRCSLHRRPLPAMVRTGQGSSCWGGGEATGNEGPVKQAWAELLPGFAMTEEVTAAFILPSPSARQQSACLCQRAKTGTASTWWEELQLGFSK